MKNLNKKEGWLNCNIDGIPKHNSIIDIINNRKVYLCLFSDKVNSKTEGYLGAARRLLDIKIGFNIWEQNDSEFIYYRYIDTKEGEIIKL